jgi:alkylresorcinol/alkylpyrone synthase
VPGISLFAQSQANGRLLTRKKTFTSMLSFATQNVPKDLSMPKAALVSLATSVPPHVFLQKDVLAAAWDVFGPRFPELDRFSSIFSNTGIIKRHAVKPFDWYLEARGWPERTAAFLTGAEELFVEVAEKALADAHLTGADIDTVVTVCSTGIATPSLEARVAGRMGFRSDVMRVPVFGLGCAGGTSGLSIAARLAQARPGSNVLLVTIELCSLALRHDELTKANIVAISLFGDGAAAVVLRAGDGGATQIEDAGEHLWPDTLGIMGWSVDREGFGVIFRRTIPAFVLAHLNPAVVQILAAMQLTLADVDRFICHPGGTKVINALETALALDQGTLDSERQVIADYGNMSSPTVLFVLQQALAKGLPARSLLTALGPGFSASCVALRHAA